MLVWSPVLNLPINPNWLFSQTARSVYLGCAFLTLAWVATLIGTHLAMSVAGAGALTPESRSLVRFLLLPEILGAALFWVAMWYFWFGFDRSHYWKRALSFILLFFLAPIGTLIYYFVTYRSGSFTAGRPMTADGSR
jgi:hypothetical protein